MKRWFTTFDEQPQHSALTVVAEPLRLRMRCQHVVGEERGRVLRIGGCGSRTGADADCVQRASISSTRAGRSDNMASLVLLCSAAPATAPAGPAKRRNTELVTEKSF